VLIGLLTYTRPFYTLRGLCKCAGGDYTVAVGEL
jgi:hypothetical protein